MFVIRLLPTTVNRWNTTFKQHQIKFLASNIVYPKWVLPFKVTYDHFIHVERIHRRKRLKKKKFSSKSAHLFSRQKRTKHVHESYQIDRMIDQNVCMVCSSFSGLWNVNITKILHCPKQIQAKVIPIQIHA